MSQYLIILTGLKRSFNKTQIKELVMRPLIYLIQLFVAGLSENIGTLLNNMTLIGQIKAPQEITLLANKLSKTIVKNRDNRKKKKKKSSGLLRKNY